MYAALRPVRARFAGHAACTVLVASLFGCSDSTSPESSVGDPPPGRWFALGEGLTGSAWAALEFEGDLVVAGTFITAGDQPARNVARWDGSRWHPFGAGLDGPGQALAVLDGDLVVGGFFGSGTSRVLRWDGSEWTPLGHFDDGGIITLVVHDGSLFAGGSSGVVRWNGTSWEPVHVEIDGEVHVANSPFVRHGDALIVGVDSDRLARWDGVRWEWMDRPPFIQLWAGDGKLFGLTGFDWVRWTGSGWEELPTAPGGGGGPFGPVAHVHGGTLLSVRQQNLHTWHLYRFDGSGWRVVGAHLDGGSLDGSARAIGSFRGAVVMSGEFTVIDGRPVRGIAAIVPDWTS